MSTTEEEKARQDELRKEMSDVWKDGNNVKDGLKLDLVEHLLNQRKVPSWVATKQLMMDHLMNTIVPSQAEAMDGSSRLTIVDVGCGLGLEVKDMAWELAKQGKRARVVGFDNNAEMIEYARQLDIGLPEGADVVVEFMKGDVTELERVFDEGTVHIIRADITIQHFHGDVRTKALSQFHRILRSGGKLVCLEPCTSAFYSSDTFVSEIYDRLLPQKRTGLTSVELFFALPQAGFCDVDIPSSSSLITLDMQGQDPGWVKLRGMANMVVDKGLLSADEASEYVERYTKAVETRQAVMCGIVAIVEGTKA